MRCGDLLEWRGRELRLQPRWMLLALPLSYRRDGESLAIRRKFE
jgi:hypothetical protein